MSEHIPDRREQIEQLEKTAAILGEAWEKTYQAIAHTKGVEGLFKDYQNDIICKCAMVMDMTNSAINLARSHVDYLKRQIGEL